MRITCPMMNLHSAQIRRTASDMVHQSEERDSAGAVWAAFLDTRTIWCPLAGRDKTSHSRLDPQPEARRPAAELNEPVPLLTRHGQGGSIKPEPGSRPPVPAALSDPQHKVPALRLCREIITAAYQPYEPRCAAQLAVPTGGRRDARRTHD
jgi:hypothetical protein